MLTWGTSTSLCGPRDEHNRGQLGHGPVPAQRHVVTAPRLLLAGFPLGCASLYIKIVTLTIVWTP